MTEKLQLIKLQEKVLEFDFKIVQVQFNKNGRYFLKISVENSHRVDLLPQILLEVNNSRNLVNINSMDTDSVVWDSSKQSVVFQKNHFRFRLPRGFCKNDKNYDVHLKIEAYSSGTSPKLVGEALFAIYPRTESPKANLLVKKGKDYYRYSSVLTLLRPSSRASISMHCGRLSYSVALREFVHVGAVEGSDDEKDPPSPSTTPSPPVDSSVTKPDKATLQRKNVLRGSDQRRHEDDRLRKAKEDRLRKEEEDRLRKEEEDRLRKEEDRRRKIEGDRLQKREEERFRKMEEDIFRKMEEDRLRRLEEVKLQTNLTGRSVDTSTQTDVVISSHSAPVPAGQDMHSDAVEGDVATNYGTESSFHISVSSVTPSPTNYPKQIVMDLPADDDRLEPERLDAKSLTVTSARVPSHSNAPPTPAHSLLRNHVAKPGSTEVYVIVHGATSLPSRSDGSDPVPFTTVKSGYDDRGNRAAQAATHASLGPTHSPTWEESMVLQVSEDDDNEEIILTVADKPSKEKLCTYRIPLSYLSPFHSYHLELVQPTAAIPSGVRLYVTLQKRHSHLRRLQGFSFCGLEVTLRDFQRDLSNSVGSMICVARIVPDYSRYKEEVLGKRQAGITTTTVTFPSPNPASFQVVKQHQGNPQISTPSHGDQRPEWMQSLLFSGDDAATMFTHHSALVLELYPTSTSMSSVTWTIRNPIGFCTLLLNDEVFRTLNSDAGRMGMRIDDLMVQGSKLKTIDGPCPSIRLAIRLITTERPDTLVVTSDVSRLPSMDDASPPQTSPASIPDVEPTPLEHDDTAIGGPPFERKKTRLLVQEDEYPPSDVLESILPDYVISVNDTDVRRSSATNREKSTNQHFEPAKSSNQKSLLDHQADELIKYREAVKRMSHDMIAMRGNTARLQEENARLRSELLLTKEMGRSVMDDISRGVVSSAEVADKFVAVTQKLTKESDDLKKYKGKVQRLQNQMIKANEREKGYLSDNVTRKEQEDTIEKLKAKDRKGKKLQETCLQQEKVIRKMESLLSKYMKSNQPKDVTNPQDQQNAVTMLSEENAKLQSELERKRAQHEEHDEDVLEMRNRLERAEDRIRSLEAQLDHNARTWAREKNELTVRLQEHRNGIVRTTDPLM